MKPGEPATRSAICAISVCGEQRIEQCMLQIGGESIAVSVGSANGMDFCCQINGAGFEMLQCGINKKKSEFSFLSNGKETRIPFALWDGHLAIFTQDGSHTFALPDPLRRDEIAGAGSGKVVSPMPGLVKVLNVAAGDQVKKGDPLLILEAMKMEHTLNAPRDGVLAEVNVREGDQVWTGQS